MVGNSMREVTYFVGFVGFEPKYVTHFFDSKPIKEPNYKRSKGIANFSRTKASHRSRRRDSKFIVDSNG